MAQRPTIVASYAGPAESFVRTATLRAGQRLANASDHLIKLASVLTLVALWYGAAALLPASVLPGPGIVVRVLWEDIRVGAIWSDVAISLTRIGLAFCVAMAAALVLGFAMGLSKTAERFLDIWMVCGISLPSLVTILIIFMVVGLNEMAAVLAAALPIVPVLAINIWGGIKAIDYKLIDMSKAFRVRRGRIIRFVVAPQVAPLIVASSRFGLGLIWKMVLFVELLGRSDGVGYKIEYYFQLFNMSEVLAHALLFLLIMLFIELVVLGEIDRRMFHWRPALRRF